MLTVVDTPVWLDDMVDQAREMAAELAERLKPLGTRCSLDRDVDILAVDKSAWYFVHDGFFRLKVGGQIVRFFMNGDLVLAEHKEYFKDWKITSEFATEVTIFPKNRVLGKMGNDPELLSLWTTWQDLEVHIREALCSIYMKQDIRPDVVIKHFKFGETILTEGDKPDGLYLLVDGEARVTVRGIEVGRVGSGEFFGEISFLTGKKRVATVKAKTNCLAQFIRRKDVARLIQYKPQLFLTISKNLAGRVVHLNDLVVDGEEHLRKENLPPIG